MTAMTVTPTAAKDAARSKRASALPADERRSMIIAATLPLLLEHGEMVTTHDIANAAGIAEGTIFRVFAGKEALIEAVIDHALDLGSVERAIEAIDDGLTLEETVTEVVGLLQQRVVDIWRLMSSVGTRFHEHARRPAMESEALVHLFDAHRGALTVDPSSAARNLRSFTLAMTHPMMVSAPVGAADVAHQFLHGVARAEPC
jgi:AcrR family transcriptional regulator